MSDAVAIGSDCPAPSTRMGFVNRLARVPILRRFAGVSAGRLNIVDADGAHEFGTAGGLRARVSVHDSAFYRKMLLGGSLGAAESYLDGDWSCDDLTALFRIFLRELDWADRFDRGPAALAMRLAAMIHRGRANTRVGSRRNIFDHYDLGNDFFSLWLDPTMAYSSALFEPNAATLEQAQTAKFERLCRMLQLTPGDHLLEIGSGWGGLAIHAADRFGCRVTTTTVSPSQRELAMARVREAGLADRVTVLLRDYRDLDGTFDKLVSIEMIEAVGHEFLGTYFARCAARLRAGGRFLLQSITMPDHRYARYRRSADFIQSYVFPGSCVPSPGALRPAFEGAGFVDEDVFEMGPHYARTLREWRRRFRANLEAVRGLGHGERFLRLWNYYLCYCEAGFDERYTGVSQYLLRRA